MEQVTHAGVTAGLTKRGQVYHASWTAGGKRHRRSTGKSELSLARQTAKKMVNATLQGQTTVESVKLSEALRMLWAEAWKNQAAGAVRRGYVEHAIQFMGDIDLSNISRERIVRWRDSLLEAGITKATANRKTSALLTLLRTAAQDWEMPIEVPKVKKLAERKSRYRYLTDDEIRQLLDVAKPDYQWVFRFAIETGFRRAEILELTWAQIDWQEQRVWVEAETSKTDIARAVPLSDRLIRYMRERFDDRGARPGPWDLTVMSLRWEWLRCKKAMGLQDDEDFVFHTLRHTCATRMVNSGTPTRTVQRWLGHASITTTEKYLNQSTRDLDQWKNHAALDF